MKKIVIAKSCNHLFIRCVVLSTILNIIFYFSTFFPFRNNYNEDMSIYIVASVLQLCASAFLGWYVRKNNQTILLQEKQTRKRYITITLLGFVFLLIIFVEPNIIITPYTFVINFVYTVFGLDRIFTIVDFTSVLICLGAVFFCKPSAVSIKCLE